MTEQKAPPRPYIFVIVKCSECLTSLSHDGDGYHCPTCNVYWATGAWDGDAAEVWLDSEEDERTWEEGE